MFTGLIERIGTVERLSRRGDGFEVRIAVPEIAAELSVGESVAVDGCCLTVEAFDPSGFLVFASEETIRKTSLASRTVGARVNIERAMRLGARLGGHIVSGHIDATGRFRSATPQGESWEIWIEAPKAILATSIPKGSIAVDGISLTLVELTGDAFSLWVIPETWRKTTLADRRPGDPVNLESDMIGKYVCRYLETLGLERDKESRFEEIARQFHGGTGE